MDAPRPAAPARHQFYVTHCATDDSALRAPGWSVRAASADDPRVLRLALDPPPYELPMDLWGRRPGRHEAPRRLARTRHPAGGVWVFHSAYLEQDTMGRDRSSFSHLLHLPAEEADPAAVLRSWAADWWVTDYPPGAPQLLDPPTPGDLDRYPGGAVSDEALTAFLGRGRLPRDPADLAVAVTPDRLRADATARRALLGRFLRGVVAAVACPDPARARLYVHAEPGLLALLLYGAVRLLPPGWAGDLTFTTFEPAHRALREYKHAQVVGTYLANDAKPLDPDLLAARGLALNTFLPDRSSDELRAASDEFDALFDLAAAGDWDTVKKVHGLVGCGRPTADRLAAVVRLVRTAERVGRDEAGVAEVLGVVRDPDGPAALAGLDEAVWRLVRDAAVGARDDARDEAVRREVRQEFRPRLRARVGELRAAAAARLLAGDLPGWEAWWEVVRDATTGDPAALAAEAAAVSAAIGPRAAGLSRDVRARLRRDLPAEPLFTPLDAGELADILGDQDCPAADRGKALAAALLTDGDLRAAAAQRVPQLPPAELAGFLAYAQARKPGPVDLVVPYVSGPDGPDRGAFLGRLIAAANGVLKPREWVSLVKNTKLLNPAWTPFLAEHGRLATVLVGLGSDANAPRAWGFYLKQLNRDLVGGKAPVQLAVCGELEAAAARLAEAGFDLARVTGEAFERFDAARVLGAVSRDPAAGKQFKPGQLRAAFLVFKLGGPSDGLELLFQRTCGGLKPSAAKGFVALLDHCYPVLAVNFNGYNGPLKEWLRVTKRAAHRADWQREFAGRIPLTGTSGAALLKPILDENPDLLDEVREELEGKLSPTGGRRPGAPWWEGKRARQVVIGAIVVIVLGVLVMMYRVIMAPDSPAGPAPAAAGGERS